MRKILLKITYTLTLFLFIGSAFASGAEKKELTKEEQEKFDRVVETAFAHREKAKLFYKKGSKEKALEELKKIVSLEFPEGAEDREEYTVKFYAYINAGKICLELEKEKEAVELLEEGVKKAPDVSVWTYDLYMTLGKAYEKLGMDKKAMKAFDKAMEISKKLEEQKKKEEEKSKDKKDR